MAHLPPFDLLCLICDYVGLPRRALGWLRDGATAEDDKRGWSKHELRQLAACMGDAPNHVDASYRWLSEKHPAIVERRFFVQYAFYWIAAHGSSSLLRAIVAAKGTRHYEQQPPWFGYHSSLAIRALCDSARYNRLENVQVLCSVLECGHRCKAFNRALVAAAEFESLDVLRYLLTQQKCNPAALINLRGWQPFQKRHATLSPACIDTIRSCLPLLLPGAVWANNNSMEVLMDESRNA